MSDVSDSDSCDSSETKGHVLNMEEELKSMTTAAKL